jgi:hypothetical protein
VSLEFSGDAPRNQSPTPSRVPLRAAPRGWVFAGVFASSVIARLPTCWRLGAYDARLFAYIGARWRGGAVPYLDVWDSKPPGIFAVMALAGASNAARIPGLVAVEAVFLAAGALVLHALVERLGARSWGAFCTACFILLGALNVYSGGGGLTEPFTVAPALAAMYCWTRGEEDGRSRWYVLAGASAGIGSLFKLPGIAPFLAISAMTALEVAALMRRPAGRLRAWLLVAAGVTIPWVATAAYFARHGVAGEFLYASLVHPFIYGATNLSAVEGLLQAGTTVYKLLVPLLPVLAVAAAGLTTAVVRAARRPDEVDRSVEPMTRDVLLVALWLAADLCGALAGGRFSSNYFAACAGSACVALAVALQALFRRTRERGARIALVAAIGAPLLITAVNDVVGAYTFRNYVSDEDDAALRAGAWLEKHADSADTLFVWEWVPVIYQRSELANAFPITTSLNLRDSAAFAQRRFLQMRDQWRAAPPSWVVLSRLRPDPALARYEREVNELVADGYELVHSEGPFTVYHLRR